MVCMPVVQGAKEEEGPPGEYANQGPRTRGDYGLQNHHTMPFRSGPPPGFEWSPPPREHMMPLEASRRFSRFGALVCTRNIKEHDNS